MLPGADDFYADASHVWYNGGPGNGAYQLIDGADPKTFVVVNQGNAHDASNIYGFSSHGEFYSETNSVEQ